MTADEVVALRETLKASLRGFVMPTAYGVGVVERRGVRFPVVNKGGSHYLPAVVLAAVLGYRSGTCAIALTEAQLRDAVATLAPVEACTAFGHPNLWAWRALLEASPTGELVAVFVGDEEDEPADGALRAFLASSGNTD